METRQFTTETFIERAVTIHGNVYDYSKSVYSNCRTKVEIICLKHGSFFQTPSKHINQGTKCPACANRPIISTKTFIERAKVVHGDLFDYSKVDYVSFSHDVEIICKKHGSFFQRPENHFRHKHGCPLCKHEKASERGVGCYNEETLSNEVHGQLYCVEMKSKKEHYCKIGITKNDYKKRLGNHGCEVILLTQTRGGLLNLYQMEQQILKELSKHRYKYRPKNSYARRMGWTECFPIKIKQHLIKTFNRICLI